MRIRFDQPISSLQFLISNLRRVLSNERFGSKPAIGGNPHELARVLPASDGHHQRGIAAMKILFRSIVAAAFAALSLPAFALDASVGSSALPSASVLSAKLMPDREGIVSWRTLASVESVIQGGKVLPRFRQSVLDLDRQQVKVQGFILALDTALAQRHFLVTAVPPHCPYCLPAGPDAIVEVYAKKPVRYGPEAVVLPASSRSSETTRRVCSTN
jgi:hypothetical protein